MGGLSFIVTGKQKVESIQIIPSKPLTEKNIPGYKTVFVGLGHSMGHFGAGISPRG
jgi:hypothetical protein